MSKIVTRSQGQNKVAFGQLYALASDVRSFQVDKVYDTLCEMIRCFPPRDLHDVEKGRVFHILLFIIFHVSNILYVSNICCDVQRVCDETLIKKCIEALPKYAPGPNALAIKTKEGFTTLYDYMTTMTVCVSSGDCMFERVPTMYERIYKSEQQNPKNMLEVQTALGACLSKETLEETLEKHKSEWESVALQRTRPETIEELQTACKKATQRTDEAEAEHDHAKKRTREAVADWERAVQETDEARAKVAKIARALESGAP